MGRFSNKRGPPQKKKCPVAYLLAYAHWPYLSVSNESYLFHEQARNQSTISFLTNHQQWPVAYHLAYAHRPHQLIQYILLIFTSSQEPNQEFLIIQKGFFQILSFPLKTFSKATCVSFCERISSPTNKLNTLYSHKKNTIASLTNYQQ